MVMTPHSSLQLNVAFKFIIERFVLVINAQRFQFSKVTIAYC